MEKKLGVFFTIVARPLFINSSLSIPSNPSPHVQTKLFLPSLFPSLSPLYIHIPVSIYLLRRPFISCPQLHLFGFPLSPSLVLLWVLPVFFSRETLMQYVAHMLSTRLNS